MSGGVSLTGTVSLVSFLGLASIQSPLRDSANNICLTPDWEESYLRRRMGVIYPDYPSTQEALQEFRETLNGPTTDVWFQVGDADWHKLPDVGVIYRTSKMGTSFEARRGASAPAGDSELFHLRRKDPCTFVDGSSSASGKSDRKKAEVCHISRVAYAGVNESPGKLPIAPPPVGAVPVDTVVWSTWKSVISALIAAGAGGGRLRSELPDMSPREILAYSANRSFKFLVGNVIGVLRSVESGFFDGLAEIVWLEPPAWFLILLRISAYGFFANKYGLASWALTWAKNLGKRCTAGHSQSVPRRRASSTPPASSTDPSSDFDDDTCVGATIFMSMEGRAISLARRDCGDPPFSECMLVEEDATASHLPDI